MVETCMKRGRNIWTLKGMSFMSNSAGMSYCEESCAEESVSRHYMRGR
jgi:hypothetical protein